MSKFENRADLLIAAGESIKMQGNAGLHRIYFKVNGVKDSAGFDYGFASFGSDARFEFPLAVVEGKAVFVGDELYKGEDKKVTIERKFDNTNCPGYEGLVYTYTNGCGNSPINSFSWNPPKPKTVLVELLREDAEYFADTIKTNPQLVYMARVAECCRKALEEK